jgi:hypothetical protein
MKETVYHTLDLTWEELQLLKGLVYTEITNEIRPDESRILDSLYNSLQRLDKYAI